MTLPRELKKGWSLDVAFWFDIPKWRADTKVFVNVFIFKVKDAARNNAAFYKKETVDYTMVTDKTKQAQLSEFLVFKRENVKWRGSPESAFFQLDLSQAGLDLESDLPKGSHLRVEIHGL